MLYQLLIFNHIRYQSIVSISITIFLSLYTLIRRENKKLIKGEDGKREEERGREKGRRGEKTGKIMFTKLSTRRNNVCLMN